MNETDEGTVLIVEDDTGTALLQRRRLERAGFQVANAATAEEALQTIEADDIQLIVLDYRLAPPRTGLDFYEQLKSAGHRFPVILVTGFSDEAIAVQALRAGVRDFVAKSSEYLDYLPEAVRRVLRQVRIERQLLEQAVLLDRVPDAILVQAIGGRIRYWSQGAERLYGWPAAEAVGRNTSELLYRASDLERLAAHRQIVERGEWSGELYQKTRDDRPIQVESRWTLMRDERDQPQSILVINTDITEKKRLEGQLLRAQRMESLGTLAGGIAHDLNNVLTPILMAVDLLKGPSLSPLQLGLLETVRATAERGAALVQQILSFARGAPGQRLPLQLQPILKETHKLLEHSLPKSIELEVVIPGDLWWITGDPTHVCQVLMNLCINARDAMPNGGRLVLAAENVALDDAMFPPAKAGPYVHLHVTDTGIGMTPEVQERIFDPFFTTKEPRQGTGLGLATVQGIVKGYGGFVTVASEPGQGSRFSVYLPARPSAVVPRVPPALPETLHGHGELILVVDDEKSIRELARTILEAHGYRVLTAKDGAAALALYGEHRGTIALVLLDLMMPVMDGPKTLHALRQLDPAARVVATSGLVGPDRFDPANLRESIPFLQKPYTVHKLLQAVQDALRV